ncbi:unnamed protein product [Urochloa humidicola]
MAAAALLRSVASKMARAPPMHSRPLLARGLHGGARFELGGSLPQPPNSNEQLRGSRFVFGAAAAAGLRPFTTKFARPLPTPHHGLFLERGLHSRTSPNSGVFGSTPPPPPPNSKTDMRTTLNKAGIGFACVTLLVIMIYMYARLLPALDGLRDKFEALSRERSNLKHILTHAIEAMELLAEGGETGNGMVGNIDEAHRHFKELEDAIKDMEAEIPDDLQAEMAKLKIALEKVRSQRKV